MFKQVVTALIVVYVPTAVSLQIRYEPLDHWTVRNVRHCRPTYIGFLVSVCLL